MRRAALVVLLALASASCVTGTGEVAVRVDELDELAESTQLAAREFEVTTNLFGRRVRVAGLVRDAYRYAATVSLDDRPLFEEVSVDDARYLRLLDPRAVRAAARGTAGASALLRGGWVVDPAGAPPEFGEGSSIAQRDPVLAAASPTLAIDLLAPATVLREVRALERLPGLLASAERVRPWNTDAADYLEADDLFPPYEADGTRFDLLPTPFDPAAVVRGFDTLEAFFRTSAVWVRDGRIARMETTFRFPPPTDERYAPVYRSFRVTADPDDPASAALTGQGVQVLRALGELRMDESRVFRPAPAGARVRAPRRAATVDLDAVLGALAGAAVPGSGTGLPAGLDDLLGGRS